MLLGWVKNQCSSNQINFFRNISIVFDTLRYVDFKFQYKSAYNLLV